MYVEQLIISVPTGKFYKIEGDEGIKTLLSFVNERFDVINLFVVEDNKLDVDVENITKLKQCEVEVEIETNESDVDCTPDGTDNNSDTAPIESNFNSDELEILVKERKRIVNNQLFHYKKLYRLMSFKDIAEARRYISLHVLTNGYNLIIKKAILKDLELFAKKKCYFVSLISGERYSLGVRVITLEEEDKCDDSCGNYKISSTTIAYYFKDKLQANSKYKVKKTRVDLKTTFNINAF